MKKAGGGGSESGCDLDREGLVRRLGLGMRPSTGAGPVQNQSHLGGIR